MIEQISDLTIFNNHYFFTFIVCTFNIQKVERGLVSRIHILHVINPIYSSTIENNGSRNVAVIDNSLVCTCICTKDVISLNKEGVVESLQS